MKTRSLWLGVATVSLTALPAEAYNYNVGPNWVNLSASSCRAESHAAEGHLLKAPGEVRVVNFVAPSGLDLQCPITRRSTTYYSAYLANPAVADRELKINVQSIVVRAQDNGASSISCSAFGEDIVTQSVLFGPTRYLCGTSGGCSTAPASTFTGTNSINLTFASSANKMVNIGIRCFVPGGSKLFYTESAIVPNP
jgi:hypothetical protein